MRTLPDEHRLVDEMHRLAVKWLRFGYRRITALLRREGWRVNVKRVHRLWKAEGLQIRRKARKRRRLGNSDNACHRRKPLGKNHVWSYDFVSDRTASGGRLRLLNVVDEFTRECLKIEVRRHFTGRDVVAVLAWSGHGHARHAGWQCKPVLRHVDVSGVDKTSNSKANMGFVNVNGVNDVLCPLI